MVTAAMVGDVSSRAEIVDTAYQMVSTSKQLYGMVRGLEGQKYDHKEHRP